MKGSFYTWADTATGRIIKGQVIQRDGLYCCKKCGCGRPCTFDDLRLDRLEVRGPSSYHVLCADCWTKKAVSTLPWTAQNTKIGIVAERGPSLLLSGSQ